MANPTTNYGFVLPTSTDLVTDLPADFDVALQGVDTRLKALQPGTTLGDLAYSSATANTNTRLGVGSNGQVLTVAGGVPSWATPSGGGGTWTNFTPTYTDITVGNGTVEARYSKTSNLVTVFFRFILGSTSSTGEYPVVTLPSPIVPLYRLTMIGTWFDSGVQSYVGSFGTDGANVNCSGIGTGGSTATQGIGRPFVLNTNDWLQFSGTYEVA